MEAAECRLMIPQHQPCCWLPPPARKKPAASRLRTLFIRVIAVVPYFMLSVTLLELGILVAGFANSQAGDTLLETLVFDPKRRSEAWRFVSYMLIHAGVAHAALNLGIQLLLATPLEREQGKRRTAIIYIGGGLAGSLSTSVLEPDLYLVGASGGVYALLTAQLANIVLNFPGLRYRVQRAVVVCVLSLADVLFSLYHHFFLGNRCPRVGWAAHTGGALAGLLIGLLIFRPPPPDACSFMGRPSLPPQPPLIVPGHKPRREAVLIAVRCGAAALLAGCLAAGIAMNVIR